MHNEYIKIEVTNSDLTFNLSPPESYSQLGHTTEACAFNVGVTLYLPWFLGYVVIPPAAPDVGDQKGRRNGSSVAFSLSLSLYFSLFPSFLLLYAFLTLGPGYSWRPPKG